MIVQPRPPPEKKLTNKEGPQGTKRHSHDTLNLNTKKKNVLGLRKTKLKKNKKGPNKNGRKTIHPKNTHSTYAI